MLISKISISAAMTVLVGLPIFGQVKFDTFPKLVEAPAITELKQQAASELRAFLWQHWTNRERAIAQFIGFSREGSPSLITYTIGPDQRQRWAITEVFQSSGVIDKGMLDLPPTIKVFYRLEVVEFQPNGSARLVSNPQSSFPEHYRLRIKNADGQESIF